MNADRIERWKAADGRLARAKQGMTEAAQAAMRGDPRAIWLAREASRELAEARAELAALEGQS